MALQPIQQNQTIFSFDGIDTAINFQHDPNGDFWVVTSDLGEVLNLKNINANLTDIPVEKKITLPINSIYMNNNKKNKRSITLIHEDEAVKLVLRVRSKDPKIVKFQNWVAEVIRTIRKTGGYSMNQNKQLELTPQQQLQKQHLDNEAKKLDMEKLKLCQQVIGKSDTPQNKRHFEQYLLNSLDNNQASSNIKAIEYTDPESYMNEGVTQLAVENNIVKQHIAQKYGSPCDRYVSTKYRKKYPNDPIQKGKKIWAANNTHISPNTYKHKYKDEILAWIREYFDKLDTDKNKAKNKDKNKTTKRSRSSTVSKSKQITSFAKK